MNVSMAILTICFFSVARELIRAAVTGAPRLRRAQVGLVLSGYERRWRPALAGANAAPPGFVRLDSVWREPRCPPCLFFHSQSVLAARP